MDLVTNIAGKEFKNPILTASGTTGTGTEIGEFFDMTRLGGLVTRAVTLNERRGNESPRVIQMASGLLNATGLQNCGVESFIQNELPALQAIREAGTCVVVNIAGSSFNEYVMVTRRLTEVGGFDFFELNTSCPNVKEGGVNFGTDPLTAANLTQAVKGCSDGIPVIVKLTPNVTNIVEIAKAVEYAGADAICAVNTLSGMDIDVSARRPALANVTGGLSGPAILPVALGAVYQIREQVRVPIIGAGGISSAIDVLKFVLAGATAVEIGTAALKDPTVYGKIIDDLQAYCDVQCISELLGAAHQK